MKNEVISKNMRGFFKRNRGGRGLTLLSLGIGLSFLFCILIAGNYIQEEMLYVDLANIFKKPSIRAIFGTDWVGRNMLLRTIKGLSLSIQIGFLCSLTSSFIAILLGIGGPLLGKTVDNGIAWLIDLTLSVPHTLVVILISIACGGGMKGIVIGVTVTHWTALTRVIRAEVMQLKVTEYVQMSRQLGKSYGFIARVHMLPHLIPQLLVGSILIFPHAILHEAAITFLGFGLPAHEPAIGIILSEAMKYLTSGQWWLAFFPGISLVIISMMVHGMGKDIEKLMNPRTAHE